MDSQPEDHGDLNPDLFGPGSGPQPTPWTSLSAMHTGQVVHVALMLRVSAKDLQNLQASLLRQIRSCETRLLPGMVIKRVYIDIESGRMDFEDRSQGTNDDLAHLDLPYQRDGGLHDMLEEAARKDRGFDMVICESADRLARLTYVNVKVEHELQRCGVELIAADEPQDSVGRKATKILLRRVKQAFGEMYAIQAMELAWEGTREHTMAGYNIGRAPYGYLPARERHPAPARAAQGATKTRLIPDPQCGEVVAEMFMLRVHNGMTFRQIAERFNADPDRYPPPVPTRERGERRWRWPVVRDMLGNPKYTGHMVWNRSTYREGLTVRRKKRKKQLHPSQWVWSPTITHEPLIDLHTYRQAQMMDLGRAGSRTGNEPNTHPATKHTYSLRSYVRCPECHRRMVGKDNNSRRYLTCRGPRNSDDKLTDRAPQHPGTVYIREESILAAVNDVINRRVFGPDRAQLLADQLAAAPAVQHSQHQAALEAAQRRLADIGRRQRSLTLDLEDADPADHAWREQLRTRHRELETERFEVANRITALQAKVIDSPRQDIELLDTIPTTEINITELPTELQRQLYDALRLQVIMTSRTTATITITLAGDDPKEVAAIALQDQHVVIDDVGTAVDPHSHKRADAGRPRIAM